VDDNTFGVFNPATGQWYLDNGNGKWDGCISGVPTTTQDQCLGQFGLPGDIPVTGDWDGIDGQVTVGVYRRIPNSSTNDQFLLTNRTSGPTVDRIFATGPGTFNYQPVVGDWNGNGLVGVGVYRPSTGTFYFKNYFTTGPMNTKSYMVNPATYSVRPVVGQWTGSGTKTQTGLYAYSGPPGKQYPYWYLDNGSRTYPSCRENQCYLFYPPGTNTATLIPATFGPSKVKGN